MSLVPTPFRIVFALLVLSLALLLSCSTSTDSGEEPPPLNKWPSKPEIDTDNGAPAANGSNVPIDTELKWISIDPDDDPLLFDVYFGTDQSPAKVATDIADMNYAPGPLEYSTKYYWKVAAKDEHNHVATSAVWNFTTTDPPQNPFIEISADSLSFGMNQTELKFTIKNTGTGTLDWNLSKETGADWLFFGPAFGTTLHKTDTITVTVDRTGLGDGLYAADLIVQSNHGLAEDIVRVEMTVVDGDYFGELSITYIHSHATMKWSFRDSIAVDFVLSVNSGKVTGTFEAVQFDTIEAAQGCNVDSLVQEPFSGTIVGTESVDSLTFNILPTGIFLSFKLECNGTEIPLPPYAYQIITHLQQLNVSIEKMDGAVAQFPLGSLPIPGWPVMTYSYKATIHKR